MGFMNDLYEQGLKNRLNGVLAIRLIFYAQPYDPDQPVGDNLPLGSRLMDMKPQGDAVTLTDLSALVRQCGRVPNGTQFIRFVGDVSVGISYDDLKKM